MSLHAQASVRTTEVVDERISWPPTPEYPTLKIQVDKALWCQDDFSELGTLLDDPVGIGGLFNREHAIDNWL
jgi:hypothetical protein